MEDLKRFTIPIKGLNVGIHQYKFDLEDDFFEYFHSTIVQKGEFKVDFEVDKRIGIIDLTIKFDGHILTPCDRCLEEIKLPIEGTQEMVVKYGAEEKEEEDIIYITPFTSELNVAKFIYEYILLSIPISKVYDCESDEDAPCNDEVLDKLDQIKYRGEDDDEEGGESPWNVLKDINF